MIGTLYGTEVIYLSIYLFSFLFLFLFLLWKFQEYHFPNVLKRIDLKVVKANFVVPVIHVRKIFSQKKQVHENIFTTINCWFHISLKRGGGKKKPVNN